ncbi:hypothetical protein UFOVP62_50 [uncultured Caudovirales phage]|uniref:Uncharacterized protein n=1 Tax=uncultured Caudovirales phage TaxID=2100421 RepID=A0A6J5KXN4_9CAUD|nr:hypothetical protein UFOVP62_50 [uncultured Caudovirales phage]
MSIQILDSRSAQEYVQAYFAKHGDKVEIGSVRFEGEGADEAAIVEFMLRGNVYAFDVWIEPTGEMHGEW